MPVTVVIETKNTLLLRGDSFRSTAYALSSDAENAVKLRFFVCAPETL